MDIPEYVILTDEKMKLHIEEGRKLMAEERFKVGMELYTGEVEAVYASDVGADLDVLDDHNADFKGMIEDMFEKLPTEKKILEGVKVPEYIPIFQNGFSTDERNNEQWRNVLPSGSLTTGPIPSSVTESSNSACFADLFNRICPLVRSDEQSIQSSEDSCSERLDDSGSEIVAMNESSECTVPMISEQPDGTLSEVKWSPPLKSMVSSEVTPLAETS
jgi:hypothetical protein